MPRRPKQVESLAHAEASRANLPSAEHQALMDDEERAPIIVEYRRRDADPLDGFYWNKTSLRLQQVVL